MNSSNTLVASLYLTFAAAAITSRIQSNLGITSYFQSHFFRQMKYLTSGLQLPVQTLPLTASLGSGQLLRNGSVLERQPEIGALDDCYSSLKQCTGDGDRFQGLLAHVRNLRDSLRPCLPVLRIVSALSSRL